MYAESGLNREAKEVDLSKKILEAREKRGHGSKGKKEEGFLL